MPAILNGPIVVIEALPDVDEMSRFLEQAATLLCQE